MSVFVMPSLGADMEDGKLVEWLVKPGDAVHRGDVVAVVETQKGAIEIEIFEDGIVQSLEADLGATLPVGAALALIGDGSAAPAAPPSNSAEQQTVESEPQPADPEAGAEAPEEAAPAVTQAPAAPAHAREGPAEPPPSGSGAMPAPATVSIGVAASPAARALAAQKDIDLAGITGSWPGGAIVLADVERATGVATPMRAPGLAAPSTPARGFNIEAMRQGIAAAMARSKREIPHYYMTHEMDLQQATDWLARKNADVGPADRLLMGALFVKATALAAKAAKGIKGSFEQGVYAFSETVNTGVAVALRGGGLVAPAIPAAGRTRPWARSWPPCAIWLPGPARDGFAPRK